MTFNEFIERIEREKEYCQKEFEGCKSNKDYLQMGKCTAIIRAYDWVLELAKDIEIGEEKHNDFSWDNVKIGDEVVEIGDENCVGKVKRLVFDSDGYCCGIIVDYDGLELVIYQDDEYKKLLRIGSWQNEVQV